MHGFFKKHLNIRSQAENLSASMPALVLRAEKIAASLSHGEHARRKSGAGHKFWQFREYITGDRPQDIDWRQSAKTDHILIRQKELQTMQKTFLWCATDKAMSYSSNSKLNTKQEEAIIICLCLAMLLIRAEEQIGVFGDIQTGRSENMIEKLSHLILQSTQKNADSINQNNTLPDIDNASIPRHSNLIMAGDFLSEIGETRKLFKKLASRIENCIVIQILDPAELTLDFNGRVLFENGLLHETINHVPSIRSKYIDRINEHNAALKKLCDENNWAYILHRTDHDLIKTMQSLWQKASTREMH